MAYGPVAIRLFRDGATAQHVVAQSKTRRARNAARGLMEGWTGYYNL